MKRLLISAFVACFAMAAPTVLMANNNKGHPGNTGSQGHPNTSNTGGNSHGNNTMMMTHHHTTTSGGSTGGTTHHFTHNNHTTVHIGITAYHRNITAGHRFHWGVYHAPPGWVYHHWGFGDHIDAIYWGRDYWITGYLNFGLVAPPDDCVWVRYGPDALLIDEDTGEIVQVVYGLFY